MDAGADRFPARPEGALDRWKRTWWVAFAAVPFGWLAFVPFVAAGRGARRRNWLWWGAGHFAGVWGATVVASVEEIDYGIRQAGALVMIAWWVAAFLHALAIRGPYLAARPRRGQREHPALGAEPAAAAERDTAGPGTLPDPKEQADEWAERRTRPAGWSRAWVDRPWGRVAYLLVTTLMVVAGVAMTFDGDPSGPAVAAFSLALACAFPLLVPRARTGAPVARAVEGAAEAGLVFAHAPARERAALASGGLMALAFALMWLTPGAFDGDDGSIRVIAPIGTVMFGLFFALGLRGLGKGFLALTPRGILARRGGSRTFVPWDAVTAVRAAELRMRHGSREPFIAVDVTDRARIETSRIARALMVLNPRSLGDVSLSTRQFDAEPTLVLETIRHFAEHPDDRQHLGSPESVAIFERIRRR